MEKELNIKDILKAIQELRKSQEKTDEQMQETDRKLKSVGIQLGNIGNNQGDVAEEFFYNSLADKPTIGGIKYDFIEKNVTRRKNGIADEYDILLVNGKDIAIIEVKYKLNENDITKLLNRKYTNFQKLYLEYQNYNHHLMLASFYMNESLKNQALDNNIAVLQRKGDIIEASLPNNT